MFFTPYHAILQYTTPDVLSVLPYNGKILNRLIFEKSQLLENFKQYF